MKKMMLLAGIVCFLFTACCNQKEEQPATEEPVAEEQVAAPQCELSEECKQAMMDWENWENLGDERKAELLAKKKECYDNHKAAEAEREAKKAAIEEKMANWDNMTLDEQKAIFDEMMQMCPKHDCHKKCCCPGECKCPKESCCKKEGCKKEGCKKEGCCKKAE